MPITDPIFIPKGKDVEFPYEFWIIPACMVDLAGTQEEINHRRAIRRRVNQLAGSRENIKTVSGDWSEEIKSLAVWGIASDALIKLIEDYAPGFFYHIVGDAVTLIDMNQGHFPLGSFREQLRANKDRPTCCIYVIRLREEILNDKKRFRRANPNYKTGKECYYVGMTSKTPEERFGVHMSGHQHASKYACEYGVELAWDKFSHLPLMSHANAETVEVHHAEDLRRQGYGVWQG
jgi:hypothetical protein